MYFSETSNYLLSNRFIYVETAFFWKWWLRQNDEIRADVKNLINQGRLEMIGGAWSMNDEAVTHYHSIIDQFTWGFRYIFNYIKHIFKLKVTIK